MRQWPEDSIGADYSALNVILRVVTHHCRDECDHERQNSENGLWISEISAFVFPILITWTCA